MVPGQLVKLGGSKMLPFTIGAVVILAALVLAGVALLIDEDY
ncbi:hypothetical protein CPT_Slocum_018 [Serratia phage Slocum]|nr:hypothetical protein CPT_Slocum_018 [Serratia phage Slocum]